MAKIVGALVGDKRFYEFADQPPEFLHGALGAFAQRGFEFRECHFDWVEVWRIGGQIADCSASSRDCFAHPVDFVGPQIAVSTENLDPDVVMMKSAQDGK